MAAKKMEIHLRYGDVDLELPVLPQSIELSSDSGNEQTTIHTTGEITLIGKPKLSQITIESTFPASRRTYQNVAELRPPYEYVDLLKEWKDSGCVLRLIITSTNITTLCTIETLSYGEEDATGDVEYKMDLKEYREHPMDASNVPSNTTSSRSGASSSAKSGKTYTVKKGDTLKKIAKKKMGKTKYSKKLYKANKKVIEAAWKKYRKKRNKEIKRWNKKHPNNKKKLLKDTTSKKGKHLVVGTKLTIPKK